MSKSGFAKDVLKSFIDRIERMEGEKAALAADIREIYSEAKGSGFDTKTIRKLIARRKLDLADLQEQDAMLDLYSTALGMDGLPFGDYDARMKAQQASQSAAGEKVAPAAKVPNPAPKMAQPPKTESQAKVDADAPAKANTQSAAGEESMSRGASARSPAATVEIMTETGGERPAPSHPEKFFVPDMPEMPSYLVRTPAPVKRELEAVA